ncbi:hypothetical protein DV495_004096 [Geotrichum candidum]|nr:hypothetical protein DV495_004096 [Geotrichum candidum]
MAPQPIKFVPFQTFADAGFFQELASRKLNDLKLSKEEIRIVGTVGISRAAGRQPDLSVSKASFDTDSASIATRPTAFGSLVNLNTIEEFKAYDKNDLLRQKVAQVYDAIVSGSVLEDPARLNTFHLLVFADLKKFLFWYWFAFPTGLGVNWHGEVLATEDRLIGLKESIDAWRKQTPVNQHGYFLLAREKSPAPEGSVWKVFTLAEYKDFHALDEADYDKYTSFSDPSTFEHLPGWPLRNYLEFLNCYDLLQYPVVAYRELAGNTFILKITNPGAENHSIVGVATDTLKVTGWERHASTNKLAPKQANLGTLLDPVKLADQAVDLNLKLMKWRIAPELDLDVIKDTKCLLLGAGTLGSYVARGLMAWGVRKITFVDNGRVSYSNPVRQPLYKFEDCINGGQPKAEQAAKALKEIYPSVESEGISLEIPMAGHPVTDAAKQQAEYDQLVELIKAHDAVFLLVDSRETRWLPTVIATALNKLIINAALGFDSYVVMRHGQGESQPHLGCYFCNDVMAPLDSLSNRTLDQMCTVTRPGVAMLASAYAVEILVSLLQHPLRGYAPHDAATPHQIRGFLHSFETLRIEGQHYTSCSACSANITTAWRAEGWDFVRKAFDVPSYIEDLSGLTEIKRRVDELAVSDWDEDEDED